MAPWVPVRTNPSLASSWRLEHAKAAADLLFPDQDDDDEVVSEADIFLSDPKNDNLDFEKVTTWRYEPYIDLEMDIREEPNADALRTGQVLEPGEFFEVSQEVEDADGTVFLFLADGRGWVFDRSADGGTLCVRDEASADGRWLKDGQHFATIADGCLTWAGEDNASQTVVLVNGCFQMEFDGETFAAKISDDRSMLSWSDGDVWIREEEAIRSRSHLSRVRCLRGQRYSGRNDRDGRRDKSGGDRFVLKGTSGVDEEDCFPRDTVLELADGSHIFVQNVRTGHKLRGADGSETTVRSEVPAKSCDLLQLTASRGAQLRITKSHRVAVPVPETSGSMEVPWIKASQLKAGHIVSLCDGSVDSLVSVVPCEGIEDVFAIFLSQDVPLAAFNMQRPGSAISSYARDEPHRARRGRNRHADTVSVPDTDHGGLS